MNPKVSFKDKHRSKFNQRSIKEIKLGVLGSGCTFGDVDAYRSRGYMYTLRTVSQDVHLFEIQTSDFLNMLKGHGREPEFRRWAKAHDQ